MLDTIILTIPRGFYHIQKAYMFMPNANVLNGPGNYLVRCVNNPTANDKRNRIYRPRLTLIKRMTKNATELPLKIEFSVAKMLFGNNVEEVQEKDFESVVRALAKAMSEMGVVVSSEDIASAKVSAFHPSKNVELKDHYTSRFVINEIKKINSSQKFDADHKDFRNEGHAFQFFTISHSLVIYDKVQDIRKPEKRAIDRDQNSVQLSLFNTLKKKGKKEILRIEARLSKKVKLNSVLRNLGYKDNPTFKDIFKKDLCQEILQSYWKEIIISKNLFVFDMESNSKKTLEKVFKNRPNIKPKDAIYLVGLQMLSKQGIRDTRAIIEQYAATRTWYRIAKDLPFLDEISDKTYHGWVKQINDSLDAFEPCRVERARHSISENAYGPLH